MTEEQLIDYIDSKIKTNGKRNIVGSVLNTALKAIIGLISGASSVAWGNITGDITDQSDLQSALSGKQDSLGFTPENSANKGNANGYAPLNSSIKIDTNYFPDSILGQLLYGGVVNASTAVATLTNSAKSKLGTALSSITLTNDATAITGYVANEGIYYIATTSGTFASISFEVGDWLVSIGSSWQKIDNTDAITSFNGRTGAITLTSGDVTTALGYTPVTDVRTVNGHALSSNVVVTLADLALYHYHIVTPSVVHTGTTSETMIWSKKIDANSFNNTEDLFDFMVQAIRPSGLGAGNANIYVKLGTSSTMPSGSTGIIGQNSMSSTIVSAPVERHGTISSGTLRVMARGANLPSDLSNASSPATTSTLAFDFTTDLWIFVSVTLSNSSDSIQLTRFYLRNL